MSDLDVLLPARASGPMDTFRLGTVTQIDPLRVKLDGDSAALDVDPINTFGPVTVGDRVWCQIHGKVLLVVGSPTAPQRDLLTRNLGASFMGGGRRTASSTAIAWDQRFILMGNGRDDTLSPSGFVNIDKPADGTVIPVHNVNNQTSVTVASGIVPLAVWQTLWYDVKNAPAATEAARFHITGYDKPFTVPPTWIPVCRRNNDLGSVVWADGRETSWWTYPSLNSGYSAYGSGYLAPRYRRENNIVYLQGLIRAATTTTTGTIFTLPAAFRPEGTLIFITHASGGVTDLRVYSSGSVAVAGYLAGGNGNDVSLSGISFPVDL